MAGLTVTKTELIAGLWRGHVKDARSARTEAPRIVVLHNDRPLENVELTASARDPNLWDLEFEIPTSAIADGIQLFLISDETTGETLESFAIATGEAMEEDQQLQLLMLRAEFDLLKRAFRKHFRNT